MNPAEVIEREPEHDSRAMILKLPAEAVSQPSKAADAHPHAEILTLNEIAQKAIAARWAKKRESK